MADLKTPFYGDLTKSHFIYTRIDTVLSSRIEEVKILKGFKNKSQTIRRLLSWVFENHLEDQIPSDLQKTEDVNRDQLIYTRIEHHLLMQIDELKARKNFTNRSHAIRKIIHCAFDNGADTA